MYIRLKNKNNQEVILTQGGMGGELISKSSVGYTMQKDRISFEHTFVMSASSFAKSTEIHRKVKELQYV